MKKRKILTSLFSLVLATNFTVSSCANDHLKVEKRDIEVPYITQKGEIDRRTVRVFIPETFEKPLPLVFVAHYPIGESSREYTEFISKGWAIATFADFKPVGHGASLTDDNLVFNSAALSVVRKMPEIDRTRISVMGGSAGGYMSLMLSALHLGICSSVSIAGITNIRFNMMDYFDHAHSYNLKEIEKLDENERGNMQRRLEIMPIPVLGSIYDVFIPLKDNFPDRNDANRWAAYSPASLTGCFSNPILFTHFTSDLLVPIDQVTKRFTYENGNTLPEGYKLRLSEYDLPEILQHSLAEAVPDEDLSERIFPVSDEMKVINPEFDDSRRINIVVFDEGPVEATAGHVNKAAVYISYTAYFETNFALSSRQTNLLTVEKLELLAERYAGKSVQLPVRETSDETIYGSAAKYRADVLEELSNFAEDCGKEKLPEIFKKTAVKRPDLAKALDEIKTATL